MTDQDRVVMSAEGDAVIVTHPSLVTNRAARMFFGSILGATLKDDGWICPRRRRPLGEVVVRINTFLESKGWVVERVSIVDDVVQRDIERKRSFQRTRRSAVAFRDEGTSEVDLPTTVRAMEQAGWDSDARSLRPHQQWGVVHSLTAINAANFSVPGSGKTATTLAVAATHLAAETIDVVIVVGPLSSFAPWEKESRTALQDTFRVSRVRGSAQARRDMYAAAERGALLLTSYASAASDKSAIIELCKRLKVMLVVDESHRVKRFRGGVWAPALVEVARDARVRTILSGTPMPQSGKDLYSQLNILWPRGDLTGPPETFATRVTRDFAGVLNDVLPFVSRTPKEALGLPPYTVTVHDVEMDGTQAEVYELVESHFRKRVEGIGAWRDKIERLRRGRPIRLLQAASNPDLLNRRDSYFSLPRMEVPNATLMDRLAMYRVTDVPAKSLKALELVRGIAGEGGKVVCWSNFVPNLDHFTSLVRAKLSVPTYQIDGRVPAGDETIDDAQNDHPQNPGDDDTREQIIDRFLNLPGPAVLVTNPASCSESISLHTSCHNAVYLDRTYDCALFLQSIDRIHRLGLPDNVQVRIHIVQVTRDGNPTVDHLVAGALARKEATMRTLLEGASLEPVGQLDPLTDAEGSLEDLAELLRYFLGEDG
ncbi:MAG: hypothetical protein GEV06_24250 [Luteitalea sp.]|nr:hypothetical protein [Luteitalea sp.]